MPTIYAQCASTYQVVSEYPTTAFMNSGVTVFGTGFSNIPPVPTWSVVLQPIPSGTPVTVTSFASGGPKVTSGTNVSATFTLLNPALGGYVAPGVYSVTLSDGSAADTVVSGTTLTVTPSPGALSPASGPQGTSVSATASGFQTTKPLTVQVGGTAATITSGGTTSSSGTAAVTFTVPTTPTLTGSQNVVISDGTYTSTSTFTVAPTVGGPGPAVVPPASAVAGSTVQISSISYWNSSTSAFEATCGPNDNTGIQLVTLKATGPSGVTDTLQMVITNPAFGAPPGPTIAAATASPSSPLPGQQITLTTSLTPGSPPACSTQVSPNTCYPSGTVSWTITGISGSQPCASTPISPPPVGSNVSTSTCVIPGSQVVAGTYQIVIRYQGDPAYGPATGSSSITVLQPTPTMVVTAGSAVATENLTFTATVSGPGGATQPTGQVTWAFSSPSGQTCPRRR